MVSSGFCHFCHFALGLVLGGFQGSNLKASKFWNLEPLRSKQFFRVPVTHCAANF